MNIDKNVKGYVDKDTVPEICDCVAVPIHQACIELYAIEEEVMPFDLRPGLWYVTFKGKKLAAFNDEASAEKYYKAIIDEIAPIIDKYNL